MTPQENKELEFAVPDEVSVLPQGFEEKEGRRDFPESLIVLAKHKRRIAYFTAGVAVLSAVISLLLPKWYTANAKILPPQQNQSVAASMLGQLGPLGPLLAGGGGGLLGIHNPNEMYISMLRSRTVGDKLIDRFDLMKVYQLKLRVEALKHLGTVTEITSGAKDNIISISVEDRDPKLAAEITNAYVDELDKLTKTLAVTDAGKRRIFFEREAKSATDDLATAEQELKLTEEKTGVIEPSSQSRVMLQAYADLRAAVTAKEVEVEAMKSFATPNNPDLVRVENELAALKGQVSAYEAGHGGRPIGDIALEKVPARALEYFRKLREVKYREAVMELMLKQYEIARIDEAKDSSMIQVLDKALPPEKRSWPSRTLLVLASTLLALMIATGSALLIEKIERAREDPRFAARLRLFRFYLWGPRKR